MQYHKQRFFHMPSEGMVGDCYRTALGCLLDLAPEQVPHFIGNHFNFATGEAPPGSVDKAMKEWLATQGYSVFTVAFTAALGDVLAAMMQWNPDTYYLVSGKSPREVNHVVIAYNDAIVWDPARPRPGESTEALIGPCSDGHHWVEVLIPMQVVNHDHYGVGAPVFFEAPETSGEPQAEDEEDASAITYDPRRA